MCDEPKPPQGRVKIGDVEVPFTHFQFKTLKAGVDPGAPGADHTVVAPAVFQPLQVDHGFVVAMQQHINVVTSEMIAALGIPQAMFAVDGPSLLGTPALKSTLEELARKDAAMVEFWRHCAELLRPPDPYLVPGSILVNGRWVHVPRGSLRVVDDLVVVRSRRRLCGVNLGVGPATLSVPAPILVGGIPATVSVDAPMIRHAVPPGGEFDLPLLRP